MHAAGGSEHDESGVGGTAAMPRERARVTAVGEGGRGHACLMPYPTRPFPPMCPPPPPIRAKFGW